MSKWSSNDKAQRLHENFRRFSEQDASSEEAPPQEESGGLININAGPDEVLKKVPQLLADPKLKAILRAGGTDKKGSADEVVAIKPETRMAAQLMPTQSQIGTGQSLNDQAGDKWGNLDRAIEGGKLASGSGKFPILVFGNHVLDGHHRWSQFITTNPRAVVDVANIVAPGLTDEKSALALLHYMNFALFGSSPTKDFKGINVYEMDADQIKSEALKNMAESTPKKLAAAGLIKEPTPEAAATHFANNLSKIPGPGEFPRIKMPQPADAGSPDGFATTPEPAAAGEINYRAPSPKDVRESNKRSSGRFLFYRKGRVITVKKNK